MLQLRNFIILITHLSLTFGIMERCGGNVIERNGFIIQVCLLATNITFERFLKSTPVFSIDVLRQSIEKISVSHKS